MILLDEASSVPENVRDAFYSTIRWIFTDRTAYNSSLNLQKLNFVFAGVFEPHRLIENGENSPFNVSRIFRLPDFSKRESDKLLQQIESDFKVELPDEVYDRVYGKVNGHPYYTQALANSLFEELQNYPKLTFRGTTLSEIIDNGINEASDNVEHIGKTVLSYYKEMSKEESKEFILAKILKGETVPFTRAMTQTAKLELYGVISEGPDGNCKLRSEVVEDTMRKLFSNGRPQSKKRNPQISEGFSDRIVSQKLDKSIHKIKNLIAKCLIDNYVF